MLAMVMLHYADIQPRNDIREETGSIHCMSAHCGLNRKNTLLPGHLLVSRRAISGRGKLLLSRKQENAFRGLRLSRSLPSRAIFNKAKALALLRFEGPLQFFQRRISFHHGP